MLITCSLASTSLGSASVDGGATLGNATERHESKEMVPTSKATFILTQNAIQAPVECGDNPAKACMWRRRGFLGFCIERQAAKLSSRVSQSSWVCRNSQSSRMRHQGRRNQHMSR